MRKKVMLLFVVLSIAVGLSGQFSHFLNVFDPETNDAKSEALGRTSILSSSGANFVFNNPSMLSNLTNMNIQCNLRSLFGADEYKYQYDELKYKSKFERKFHFKFNGASFSMPYKIGSNDNLKLGFGAGFRTYYDWGFDINYNQKDSDFEWKKKFHGGFNTIVFGSGLKYNNKFLIGASFSMPFLSTFTTEYDDNDNIPDNDIEESEVTVKGSFFTLSSSLILNKKFTAGVRLRTGFKLKMSDDEAEIYEYDFSIPAEYGIAIKLKPTALTILYAEYLSRSLGEYEIDDIDGNDWLYGDSENGFSFRTGIEMKEKNSENVFLLGFLIQSVPVYEAESYNDTLGVLYDSKPLAELGYTAGFSLKISPELTLDLYGVYSMLNYEEKYFEDENSNYQVKNDYSYTRIKIGCSLGYTF